MTTESIKQKLFHETGGVCAYCGHKVSISSMEIEHIIPKSHGGKDDCSNLICSCHECNFKKKDYYPSQFLSTLSVRKRKGLNNRLTHLVKASRLSEEKMNLLLSTSAELVSFNSQNLSENEIAIDVGSICGRKITIWLKVE